MYIQYIVLNPHTFVFTSTIYKVIHSIFELWQPTFLLTKLINLYYESGSIFMIFVQTVASW